MDKCYKEEDNVEHDIKKLEKLEKIFLNKNDDNSVIALETAKGLKIDLIQHIKDNYTDLHKFIKPFDKFEYKDVTMDSNLDVILNMKDYLVDFLNINYLNLSKRGNIIFPKNFDKITVNYLYMTECRLEEIPKEILNIKSLNSLNLCKNKLKEIPEEIKYYKDLDFLEIAANKLTYIPEHIGELENLETLFFYNNPIKEIHPNITKLKKLTYLNLERTHIKKEQLTEISKELPKTSILINEGIFINGKFIGID